MDTNQVYSITYYHQVQQYLHEVEIECQFFSTHKVRGLLQEEIPVLRNLLHRLHSLKSLAPQLLGSKLLSEIQDLESDAKKGVEETEFSKGQLLNIICKKLLALISFLKSKIGRLLDPERQLASSNLNDEGITESKESQDVEKKHGNSKINVPLIEADWLMAELAPKDELLIQDALSYNERVYSLEIRIVEESKLPEIRQQLFFTKLEEDYNLIKELQIDSTQVVFVLTSKQTMEDINLELSSDLISILGIRDISSYFADKGIEGQSDRRKVSSDVSVSSNTTGSFNREDISLSHRALNFKDALIDLINIMEEQGEIKIESLIEITPLLDDRSWNTLFEISSQALRNSIKAAKKNGLSSFRSSIRLVQDDNDAQSVIFSISDTCGGLDLDELLPNESPLILEHMQATDIYEKILGRSGIKMGKLNFWGGLGLGLERMHYLSYFVLQGTDLLFSMEEDEEKGTCFQVKIPRYGLWQEGQVLSAMAMDLEVKELLIDTLHSSFQIEAEKSLLYSNENNHTGIFQRGRFFQLSFPDSEAMIISKTTIPETFLNDIDMNKWKYFLLFDPIEEVFGDQPFFLLSAGPAQSVKIRLAQDRKIHRANSGMPMYFF